VSGDAATAKALFAPDCAVLIVGDMPFCGWMDVDAFFNETMILPLDGPIRFEVGDVVAEDDRVWFEAQSSALQTGGQDYRNVYIFQMRFRGGLIIEYKELGDTLHAYRLIDDPAVRGDPQSPRPPLFLTPAHVFTGGAIGESMRDA
jgi:ketosteroid isomerase-like protein